MPSIIDSGLRTQDSGLRFYLQLSRRQTWQSVFQICVRLAGRLGNQFFRYASARALQVKFYPNYKLVLATGAFLHCTDQQKLEGFENSLKYFNIENVTYEEKRQIDLHSLFRLCLIAGRDYVLAKILPCNFLKSVDTRFFQPIFNILGIYNPMSVSDYVKPIKSKSHNIFCNANFENPEYFSDIREILLEEFTPKHDVLPHNTAFLNDICTSESVCVSIRRGDFLSPKNNTVFNVCNEEYFVKAMKAINEEIPNCKFFIFSDDIEDVRQNFRFPFDVTYERGDDPVWEKLRLMYSCRHFIISNSTFSWWAQYLSRNENKIVYAPKPWHWRGEKWEGLYLPYMRIIKCNKN